MCLHCCEFWTWRIASCSIAVACMAIGFAFGPLHTIFYFTDPRPETTKLSQKEPFLAFFMWSIVALMWYICLSHISLLLACYNRSVKLLNVYINLTIFQLGVTFLLCLTYLVLCTLIDKYCFDHGKRGDNDVGAAVGIMIANLVYVAAGIMVIFAVCNYKLTLR